MSAETHKLGDTTYRVFQCRDCGKTAVLNVNTYYGRRGRERVASLPLLPNYVADELCECPENQQDEDTI